MIPNTKIEFRLDYYIIILFFDWVENSEPLKSVFEEIPR